MSVPTGTAQPQGVCSPAGNPRGGGRVRQLSGCAAPHADRSRRRAGGDRWRPSCHQRQRDRGWVHRWLPPLPTSGPLACVIWTKPGCTCTSSPTAGCEPVATSPRPSPAELMPSCWARPSPHPANRRVTASTGAAPRCTRHSRRAGLLTSATLSRWRHTLLGPAIGSDGSTNIFGALRQSMAALGYETVKELQKAELILRAGP